MSIDEIDRLLSQAYGTPRWHPSGDPLSGLMGTILSQNTSDANSGRAFARLTQTFGSWDEVERASVERIASAIAGGGLSRVKAPRIKAILERIRGERGWLDLGFLGDMPLAEARAWLESLPGVGPKTAACVLLFSLGRPALPVDTHVYRVSRRLGLIGNGVSPAQAHELLESQIRPEAVYSFHVNMVRHGREVCRAGRPRCRECVLLSECVYGEREVRTAGGRGHREPAAGVPGEAG